MISETRIDETFPSRQFCIEGFAPPYMLDRNCHGGGILLYIREDIPSKLIEMNTSVESIFIELNLKKKKWLVNCSYNANKSTQLWSSRKYRKMLRYPSNKLWQTSLMGDFNAEEANIHIKDLCNSCKLKNLIKVSTCVKNPDNLLIWCWQTQFTVVKTHAHFKKVYLTFIKWQLLFLNHTWKRNNLKSYFIGTLGNSKTMILEHKFWEYFQLCIYLVTPRP